MGYIHFVVFASQLQIKYIIYINNSLLLLLFKIY